jgi:hypothetical protein
MSLLSFTDVRMKPHTRRPKKALHGTLSDSELFRIDRDVERYIEKWLRHVILVDDDGARRRLTAAEIREAMKFTRPGNRRSSENYRRRR